MSTQHSTITIPMPFKLGMRRGIESLASNGTPTTIRVHDTDLEMLHEEARALGMRRGELIRWLIVFGGQALRHKRTGQKVDIVP